MPNLTPEGLRIVTGIATQNGVSVEAALHLLDALAQGGGAQAQFQHPELGGMGQWSQGGMIMIGDMFNHGLKARVDRLCQDLAALWRDQPAHFPPSAAPGAGAPWWPEDLGVPASVGAQNDERYAYFPQTRRLAIRRNGQIRVYDAGEHRISGVSQQQSGDSSLSFNSQLGPVRIEELRLVSPAPAAPEAAPEPPLPERASDSGAILATIERLAELRQKNILTEEEFAAKKRELLSRL